MTNRPQSDEPREQTWSARYGERHRLHRIVDFPVGIRPPQKVRIYERAGHYVLQAWDPFRKATLSDRVDGDLLAAMIRAREIDERLAQFRRTGHHSGRLKPAALVAQFLQDLEQRSNAGEISPRTVMRYRHALRYYLDFSAAPEQARFLDVARTDRNFQRTFATALRTASIRPRPDSPPSLRRLSSGDFVLDVVRAMFCWAADPGRGGLLGDGFLNPFLRRGFSRARSRQDLTREPGITLAMLSELISTCDAWQLPVFTGLGLWGLRPSELSWLFQEDCSDEWLTVRCRPDLEYRTKGGVDKRLPLLKDNDLANALPLVRGGLLFRKRSATNADLPLTSREMIAQFRERTHGVTSAQARLTIREKLLREWGGLDYDTLDREFRLLRRRLEWPKTATLKGFRHLFATCLENGGMPEYYRRYLMGHSTGRSAIVTYTHLNQLRKQYERILETEFAPVLTAIRTRLHDLSDAEAGQRGLSC